MAYVGNEKALTQIEAPGAPGSLKLYGSLAFLLWRSVYITKQVSPRGDGCCRAAHGVRIMKPLNLRLVVGIPVRYSDSHH